MQKVVADLISTFASWPASIRFVETSVTAWINASALWISATFKASSACIRGASKARCAALI